MDFNNLKDIAEEIKHGADKFATEAVILGNEVFDAVQEYRNDYAFRSGVDETSDVPVIFIDPKGFQLEDSEAHDALKLAALKEQIEGQVLGSSGALAENIEAVTNLKGDEALIALARHFRSSGPMAILDNVVVGENEYCVVNKPDQRVDTKAGIIRALTYGRVDFTDEQIDQNFPGTDRDWMNVAGLHEGAHCGSDRLKNNLEGLNEEARADRVAMEHLSPEMAQAWADVRHIVSFYGGDVHDTTHATGPLLGEKTEASIFHIMIAPKYAAEMHKSIEGTFDWDSYRGKADDPASLLKENPEIYFAAVHKDTEESKTKLVDAYNKDPSFENTGDVILAQVALDYVGNFEGAYRRRVLGQLDTPVREPSQLIPIEAEDAYFVERASRQEAAANQKIENATVQPPSSPPESEKIKPYTTRVDVPAGGKPVFKQNEDLVEKSDLVVKGDRNMPEFFGEQANPNPENVSRTDPYVDPAAISASAAAPGQTQIQAM